MRGKSPTLRQSQSLAESRWCWVLLSVLRSTPAAPGCWHGECAPFVAAGAQRCWGCMTSDAHWGCTQPGDRPRRMWTLNLRNAFVDTKVVRFTCLLTSSSIAVIYFAANPAKSVVYVIYNGLEWGSIVPQDKGEARGLFIGTRKMEVHAKVIEYEHFLNERLRSDLKKVCSLNTNTCWG